MHPLKLARYSECELFSQEERDTHAHAGIIPAVACSGAPPGAAATYIRGLSMMLLSAVRRSAVARARKPRTIRLALLLLLAAKAAAAASEAAAAKNKTKPGVTKATEEPVISSPGEAEARYSGAVRGDDVWTPPPTTVADASDGGGGGGNGPCKTAIERMLSPVSSAAV